MSTTEARGASTKNEENAIHEAPHLGVPLAFISGAAAGAAVGAMAGPLGAVVGAALGAGAAGIAQELAHEAAVEQRAHDDELDREIGVVDGDLGAALPDAQPPTRGAFSCAAMGVHPTHRAPAEGIVPSEDEA